ncbi:hypothetical protein M422DRAFT_260054 [Sphaerobolus stellatus SS14]|uniref:Uncharacterized protein n=1 Tax=Sphaerobolus stellatus (strain SS14) TaxID=990650 RepID=A0A0C9VIM6_SPHS4|nr:hypothetical protein M422DRAFT_260054 [Sphaerobolus stellatus SS14]
MPHPKYAKLFFLLIYGKGLSGGELKDFTMVKEMLPAICYAMCQDPEIWDPNTKAMMEKTTNERFDRWKKGRETLWKEHIEFLRQFVFLSAVETTLMKIKERGKSVDKNCLNMKLGCPFGNEECEMGWAAAESYARSIIEESGYDFGSGKSRSGRNSAARWEGTSENREKDWEWEDGQIIDKFAGDEDNKEEPGWDWDLFDASYGHEEMVDSGSGSTEKMDVSSSSAHVSTGTSSLPSSRGSQLFDLNDISNSCPSVPLSTCSNSFTPPFNGDPTLPVHGGPASKSDAGSLNPTQLLVHASTSAQPQSASQSQPKLHIPPSIDPLASLSSLVPAQFTISIWDTPITPPLSSYSSSSSGLSGGIEKNNEGERMDCGCRERINEAVKGERERVWEMLGGIFGSGRRDPAG